MQPINLSTLYQSEGIQAYGALLGLSAPRRALPCLVSPCVHFRGQREEKPQLRADSCSAEAFAGDCAVDLSVFLNYLAPPVVLFVESVGTCYLDCSIGESLCQLV